MPGGGLAAITNTRLLALREEKREGGGREERAGRREEGAGSRMQGAGCKEEEGAGRGAPLIPAASLVFSPAPLVSRWAGRHVTGLMTSADVKRTAPSGDLL